MPSVKRGNYHAGDFERLVRSLNPRIRIKRGEKNTNWAQMQYWQPVWNPEYTLFDNRCDGNWADICTVPVNWLPERTILNERGTQWKRGWREILDILKRSGKARLPHWLGMDGPRGVERYGQLHKILSDGTMLPCAGRNMMEAVV